ncbi:uncharacterized protein LAJ45_00107 [Morchella importuna]|nr:uncharacterized protein LAJ45_00107 [Morchella importuna]KAH8155098.1 hypothetical protein LAJ45_00107 [Morchella importuna]
MASTPNITNTPPTTPPFQGFSAPPLRRIASTSSTTSSSSSARSSLGGRSDTTTRKRGFMRPQGTEFSTSARSRESVMALGSITHLQYFFAKTGLLDGKGAGLQTKQSSRKSSNQLTLDTSSASLLQDSTYSSLRSSPDILGPCEQEFFSESPTESEMLDDFDYDESSMLPPTTSTYNPQTKSIPPTPDPSVLRERLRSALSATRVAWVQSPVVPQKTGGQESGDNSSEIELPPGFNELQGTQLVELATSAIRAAKAYYITTDSSLLLSTKDDKTLREKFLAILDILKSMAQRKFEGGVKAEEKDSVVSWIGSVEESLSAEEKAIFDMRKKGREWLEGEWEGREMDRNRLFLSYFDSSTEHLPPATPSTETPTLPTPFLLALQSGLRLILIHNAVVRRSKRPFGQIGTYHTEFTKPYRLAENLKFWKKAAEIRWEIRMQFDVMAVVNGTEDGWRAFDKDIRLWCEKVLEEIRRDWEMGAGAAVVGHEIVVRQGRSGTMESLNVEVGAGYHN